MWAIPTTITPNVWIITSPPTAVSSGIMLICPGETPRSIKPKTPILILQLQPAVQSYTSTFSPTTMHYETHVLTVNISLNTTNVNVINISSPEFRIWQHLEDHWNRTLFHHLVNIQSEPIDWPYKQMANSNGPINPFTSTDESIGHTISALDTIFPCRHLHYHYRIAHTCRIRDNLLLLSGADLPN